MSLFSFLTFGCAVCFGDPSSLASKALVSGVFLLFGVVAFVLSCIACTAWKWSRRAKKLEAAE